MGSCVSTPDHGKKKAAVSGVAREEEHRKDYPVILSRKGRGDDKKSELPVELLPSVWEHLPDDLIRVVLSKLPLSSVIHLRCVSKQWNSWILSSTIASPFSFNELLDCPVHPLIIFMYTLILVRDLDNHTPLARFFHIKLRLEAHYADVFGWRPRAEASSGGDLYLCNHAHQDCASSLPSGPPKVRHRISNAWLREWFRS